MNAAQGIQKSLYTNLFVPKNCTFVSLHPDSAERDVEDLAMAIKGGLRMGQIGVLLIVHDVTAAAEFYCNVLGAEKIASHFVPYSPGASPQLASVELRFGEALLTVQQENPRWREAPRPDWPRSPISTGAASIGFTLYVDDVDKVFDRALAAGATAQTPQGPQDSYWGDRAVQIHDLFGHLWRLQTRIEDVAREDLAGRFEALRNAQH